MSQKRKLHQLLGTINYAWLGTSASKIYKNQPFYCLETELQSLFTKSKSTIYALSNLVSPEIWKTLKTEAFKGKTYLFFCEKRVRGWRLKKWEEL